MFIKGQNLTSRPIAKFSGRVSLNVVLNTTLILYRYHFNILRSKASKGIYKRGIQKYACNFAIIDNTRNRISSGY